MHTFVAAELVESGPGGTSSRMSTMSSDTEREMKSAACRPTSLARCSKAELLGPDSRICRANRAASRASSVITSFRGAEFWSPCLTSRVGTVAVSRRTVRAPRPADSADEIVAVFTGGRSAEPSEAGDRPEQRIHRPPGAVAVRDVPPGRTDPHPPSDPVDELPFRPRRRPTRPRGHRRQRFQPRAHCSSVRSSRLVTARVATRSPVFRFFLVDEPSTGDLTYFTITTRPSYGLRGRA